MKENINLGKRFDLEERVVKFSNSITDFCNSLPKNLITNPLINQLVRAGTSIGTNYSEATECDSKRDFISKISIARKEAKETRYWLRIIVHRLPKFKFEARVLWKEAQELNLIFASIIRKTKGRQL